MIPDGEYAMRQRALELAIDAERALTCDESLKLTIAQRAAVFLKFLKEGNPDGDLDIEDKAKEPQ